MWQLVYWSSFRHRNFAIFFNALVYSGGGHSGFKKLETFSYHTVQSIFRYLESFRRDSQVWQTERQTDGQTDRRSVWLIAYAALHYVARPIKWVQHRIVTQSSHASLKVLESTWIFYPKFKALKVLENRTGTWKSLNFIPQVLESPWIYQVKLRDISNFVKQVFCLKQDLLLIVMFCFYQLKLFRNHRNRY